MNKDGARRIPWIKKNPKVTVKRYRKNKKFFKYMQYQCQRHSIGGGQLSEHQLLKCDSVNYELSYVDPKSKWQSLTFIFILHFFLFYGFTEVSSYFRSFLWSKEFGTEVSWFKSELLEWDNCESFLELTCTLKSGHFS